MVQFSALQENDSKITASVDKAEFNICKAVKEQCVKQSWPCNPDTLDKLNLHIPVILSTFLHCLINGNDPQITHLMECLIDSIARNIMNAIKRGILKPVKHILLPSAVKSFKNKIIAVYCVPNK